AQPAKADSVCVLTLPPPFITFTATCTDPNGNGTSSVFSPIGLSYVAGGAALINYGISPQTGTTTGYIESTTAGQGVLAINTDQAFTYTGTGSTLVSQATATGANTLAITAPSVTMFSGNLTALGAGSTALSVTANGGVGSGGINATIDGDILSAGLGIVLNSTNAAGDQ